MAELLEGFTPVRTNLREGFTPVDDANSSALIQPEPFQLDLTGNPLDGLPEEARKAVEPILSENDLQMINAKSYYDDKFSTNHTPEMVTQQIKYEYGESATPQIANASNQKAAEWGKTLGGLQAKLLKNPFLAVAPGKKDPYKLPKIDAAVFAMVENSKAMVKQFPEWITTSLVQQGLAPQPSLGAPQIPLPTKRWEEYQSNLTEAAFSIGESETFKKLRASAAPNLEKAQEYASEVRSPTSQSFVSSIKEGDWSQLGRDVADSFILEAPNFGVMMGLAAVNPALGLAYAGGSTGSLRYAEGIKEGEDPFHAASVANIHMIAEVGFEWGGSIGMLSKTMRKNAKKEFGRGFAEKAIDWTREPATEMATQITQNIADGKPWNEGVVEAGTIGFGFGAGMNVAISLGDATRIRKQNTNEEIAKIVEADPRIAENPAIAPIIKEAYQNPTEETVEAVNVEEARFVEEAAETASKVLDVEGKETAAVDPQAVSEEKAEARDAIITEDDVIVGASKESDNFMREELGIEQTEEPEVRAQSSVVAESLSSGRNINTLLDEIEQLPRAIQDFEVADILIEKTNIRRGIKHATKKRDLATTPEGYNKYQAQIDGLIQRTVRLTDISRLAKTETARGLAAMAMRMDETSYELVDVIERATNAAKRPLTEDEIKDITEDTNAVNEILSEVEDADLRMDDAELIDKRKEILENIEQAKRTIKTPARPKKAVDEELARLKEIEADQDRIFTLIDDLRRMETQMNDPKVYEDPEGYKQTIRRLTDFRKTSPWFKELKASKTKDSKRKLAIMNDLLDDLNAQYTGKYRNLKEGDIVDPDDVASMKAKIKILREEMRIEDSMAAVNEDLRLISEGRVEELSIYNKENRREQKFDALEKKRNNLQRAQKKLSRRISELSRAGAFDKVLRVADFKRAIRLSLDSWIGRQGSKALFSDPKEALTAFKDSIPAYLSEDYFYERDRLMKSTESYKKSVDLMGVEYNDIDGTFEVHQEAMNSRLAEKIPLVAGSNRHMIMGINELRHHLSKKFLNRFPDESAEFYKASGDWVNELTGRGTLGGLEKSAHTLTSFLTAPRWTASNWQYLATERHAWLDDGKGKKKLDVKLLKEIEAQKARMIAGFGLMGSSLLAIGYSIGLDPEESDFLKFRKGDHVVDLMPGVSSNFRLVALAIESFAAQIGIGELENRGDVRAAFKNHMFYKLVPAIGEAFEIVTGETAVGDERTLSESLILNTLPIIVESVYQDSVKDEEELGDVIKATSIQWLGTGSSIYEDSDKKK